MSNWIKNNGKRPNLPEDTLVRWRTCEGGTAGTGANRVSDLDWALCGEPWDIDEYEVVGAAPQPPPVHPEDEYEVVGAAPQQPPIHPKKVWESEYISQLIRDDNYAEAIRVCEARLRQIKEAGL